MLLRLLSLALVAVPGQAQTPTEFEVASVKIAASQDSSRGFNTLLTGGPGSSTPERITYTNATLKMILVQAYGLKAFQISGPDWIESERYDITARVPAGVTREQFRLMLQDLLAKRFLLKVRHEPREQQVYTLSVAKNGPKIQPSREPAPAQTESSPAATGSPLPSGLSLEALRAGRGLGADGFPVMAEGRTGMAMSGTDGRVRVRARQFAIAGLTAMLVNQLNRPVLDKTGLTGLYDFTLEFAPESTPLRPPTPGDSAAADPSGAPPLSVALERQLGLKLESVKAPVDTVVVEKGSKIPIEN
jgi:uncharacterized protein (TIGR03435 family)